jgi:protein-L-isoaspartate(D-aspartate) O-methyltransferase
MQVNFSDTYRHRGLRQRMVENIRQKGINDPKVLLALEKVPRHLFAFDTAFTQRAYEDNAFPIGEGQTISQPFTVAYQTMLLNVQKGDKILEIGTGSGYQAAILLELGARVFTVERVKGLFEKVKQLFPVLGYVYVNCFYGDGYEGLPTFAPFDKILVTAAAPFVPGKLLDQLKPGGIMVIPVGGGEVQLMKRIFKNPDGTMREEDFEMFRFVPMLPGRKG